MKKVSIWAACFLLALGCLAGCGNGGGSGSGTGEPKDYAEIIRQARDPELNSVDMFNVVTSPDDRGHDLIFDGSIGFVEQDMERYAISISMVITQAYGTAIIMPAPGKTQEVLAQVEAFVVATQKSFENYLQDQYAIAMAAIVKTAPSGEVLLVMSENAAEVMAAMEAALK